MAKLEALIALYRGGGHAQMVGGRSGGLKVRAIYGGTDAAMPHLAAFPELKELDLSGTRVTGEGLGVLRYLNNLMSLRLDDTEISDAALAEIARCRYLRELSLSGCRGVTRDGIRHLAVLESLRELDLGQVALNKSDLPELERMPKLRSLCLSQTGVTDQVVATLLKCKQLEFLVLEGTQLTDAGVGQLRGLPQLHTLNLSGTHITDNALKKLVNAPSLVQIYVWKTGVSIDGLRQFMRSSGARFVYSDHLDLSRVSNKGYLEFDQDTTERHFVPHQRYDDMLPPAWEEGAGLSSVQTDNSSEDQLLPPNCGRSFDRIMMSAQDRTPHGNGSQKGDHFRRQTGVKMGTT